MYKRSFREVVPDQTQPDVWREISLNTGGAQSTLQDIKVAERANGYCYIDSSIYYTRNRFIFWRINHDVLEIVEQSLDINLSGNKLRFKFIDTPILDGITIYEAFDSVVILVPTVCSVHRLTFPHPATLYKQNELIGSHPDMSLASIFTETSVIEARDPSTFIVFDSPSTANALPHVATSLLTFDEAIFMLGYPTGEILLIRQALNGRSLQTELKHNGYMPQFISGLADKFRSKTNDGIAVTSMLLHTFGSDTYGLTLSKDGQLRTWNCSNINCISSIDILSITTQGSHNVLQDSQNQLLRKSITHNDDITLVIFISFATESMFHVFQPSVINGQFRIVRIKSLYAPGHDLVDFNLTAMHIWSLWRGDAGEGAMYTATLYREDAEGNLWMPVILEPLLKADLLPDTTNLAPREAYLKHIFYPGRFPLHVISKALSIYTKSTALIDTNLSATVLKQRVSLTIDREIHGELKEDEISDEDYLQCSNWCWSRFYSCCVQYHAIGQKLLGLLILPNVEGVVLLKKSMFSIIRPLNAVEHLMLCPDYLTVEQFMDCPALCEDLDVTDDVIKLMLVIIYLDQQLSETFKNIFEKELAQLRLPGIVMSELIIEILTNMDGEFTTLITHKLSNCRDIYQAMHKLLEILQVENYSSSQRNAEYNEFAKSQTSLNHIFSSTLGISFITQSIHQQAAVRFAVCRNLLLIQSILQERGEHEWNTLEAVRSVCLPEIVVLTQSAFATLYVTTLTTMSPLPLEDMMQRLIPLKLNPVFNLKTNTMTVVSLMDLFINSTGGFEAHKLLSKLESPKHSSNWQSFLLPYLDIAMHLIWPISSSTVFIEWLLSSGQHVWLQQYVRLLSKWCEWNKCTRCFLLAVSLITTGEFNKAEELLFKSQNGIFTEKFFHKRITVSMDSDVDEKSSCINYYMKVIQLFELHGAKSSAINMASRALASGNCEDTDIATLYSIKFVHYLALNRYDEAYSSLIANPDSEHAKDNLRTLVNTLLDTRKIDKVLLYPYTGFEEHFINIILIRARATDTISNIYYDVLYAYQIKRGPKFMRFAAAVMYEQAFRLLLHDSIEALEKQVKCYLIAINALCLCDKQLAWVARPADPNIKETTVLFPKLAGSSQAEDLVFRIQHDDDVLTIDDIRLEFELANARLRLARHNPPIQTNYYTSSNELVVLLTSARLFKYALTLCSKFDLLYDLTFQSLTKQCMFLQETEDPNSWSWLIDNDLNDLPIVSTTPSSTAWYLLQTLLEQYEEEGMTIIHKAVCQRIISMEGYLPQWILSTYKKRNPAELLRLYFFNGLLEEATSLAGEYILAALGQGPEYFGITHILAPASPPMCLPINTIESLLYELELQNQHDVEMQLQKEYNYLKDLLIKYLDTSTRISGEICRYKILQVS